MDNILASCASAYQNVDPDRGRKITSELQQTIVALIAFILNLEDYRSNLVVREMITTIPVDERSSSTPLVELLD